MIYAHKKIDSPVGKLTLIANSKGLAAILWEKDKPWTVSITHGNEDINHRVLLEVQRQLQEYFQNKRTRFDLALDFSGTEFQNKIWNALLAIPFGQTKTYSQIAHQIGNPKAVRAVGAATGKNPISIIAPCHRVIGASGKLTGFAGGLENKASLLRIEDPKRDIKLL